MGKKVYVGDVGTLLVLDTNEDISTASTTEIRVKKGDGTIATWNAHKDIIAPIDTSVIEYSTQSYTDPVTSVVTYDLNCAGIYKVQVYIILPTGWSGLGETAEFQVYDVFE